MKSLKVIASVLVCIFKLGQIRGEGTINVTYEELKELNATCPPLDTCSSLEPRYNDSLIYFKCSCDVNCVQYGTCCVDAGYKDIPDPNIKPTCRRVGGSDGYLIIDQCPKRGGSQSENEILCKDEWDGQNDVMRLVPVSSLSTNMTYKNIFCFRCNEANNVDDFFFWNVQTQYQGKSAVSEKNKHVKLEYDGSRKTWVAPLAEGGAIVPVSSPTFTAPFENVTVPKSCKYDVISQCSEYWENDVVRAKCDAYMAVTSINKDGITLEYRNPHCAICNFEDLNNYFCRPRTMFFAGHRMSKRQASSATSGSGSNKPFSFTILLDINELGNITMCDSRRVWDPYFRKCRTLRCALPGYVFKQRKCMKP